MAFGGDITNGESGRIRYRWENRCNGECRRTLSRTSGDVRWLEDPRVHDPVGDAALAEYCQIGSPRLLSAPVRQVNRDLFEGLRNWTLMWADPATARIRGEDLHILVDQDDGFSVCECNEACPPREPTGMGSGNCETTDSSMAVPPTTGLIGDGKLSSPGFTQAGRSE
jgi:hypothetical protein